jgi:ligand-binding SRPBCC domain-containing protein
MKIHVLEQSQTLPISPEEAWEFFSSPGNLDAITPPDLGFRIVGCRAEKMHEGQIITYRVKILPGLWIPWVTEIKAVDEGRAFVDEQRFGPYAFWHHRHTFAAVEGGTRMDDLVHYGLSFGPFGELARRLFVKGKLAQIFGFRRDMLERQFGPPPDAFSGKP